MRNSLDQVMERLYFAYLSLSEENKFFTNDVFSKWEKNLYIPLDSKFIDRTFKKYMAFKEDESELSSENAWLEALVLHFSKVNMISFLQDLTSVKTTLSEDRESLNELIGNICSDWDIDFENLNSLNGSRDLLIGHFCQSFRLNREIELTELLGKTFQLEALVPLIKPLEKDNLNAAINENMSTNYQVDQALVPRITRLLSEVCSSLKVSDEFRVFITNQPIQGAWIMTAMRSGEKNIITITSEMVMNLSDDELKFVIGHEIGHWLFNINDTRSLLNACYDGDENVPSFSLHNLLATWKKLAEFSADRVGLVACNSLESALSALYRVSTGLDPKMMEFNSADYINNLDDELPDSTDLRFFREDFHPPLPIRMKALSLFSNSRLYNSWSKSEKICLMDKELSDQMGELIRLLDFTSEDPLHNRRLLAITIGGFILAGIDDEIHQNEIEQIKDVLYRYVLNADFIISYVIKLIEDGADLFSLLRDTLIDLVITDEEEKYDLMNILIEVALSDGVLKREETDLLLQIGSFLKIDRENTLRVIAIFLGKGFFFEKQVPESVFELLERKHPFHSGNLNERIELANNKATNPSDLIQLASDADPFVRRLVLFNESTPEKTRLELLDSPSLMRDIHEEDNTTD